MSEPIEVVVKGSEKVIGYACPVCHMFCSPLIYAAKWDVAMQAAFEQAQSCCDRRCEDCGVSLGKDHGFRRWCPPCAAKQSAAREQERFEKATKIPEAEYDGPIFDDDEYYSSIDDLRDSFGYSHDTAPAYVWATDELKGFTLDAAQIVGDALDGEHHEDAFESVDDIEGLQKFLDEWCAKQTVTSYTADYSRAVVLEREADEEEDEDVA